MKRIDQINRLSFAYDLGFKQISYKLDTAFRDRYCDLVFSIIDDIKFEEVIFFIEAVFSHEIS